MIICCFNIYTSTHLLKNRKKLNDSIKVVNLYIVYLLRLLIIDKIINVGVLFTVLCANILYKQYKQLFYFLTYQIN